MFVKLNLLVICAVTLHFGECYNCEDVFKCVTNWVAAALSPNSNITLDIIEDITSNVSTANKSQGRNLLIDLTRFLEENFSNLIKESFFENPSLNFDENQTKVYVQTFKTNGSITETKPSRTAVISEPILKQRNNNDKNPDSKMLQNVTEEEKTSRYFQIYKEKDSVIDIIRPTADGSEAKSDMINKNNLSENSYNINGNTLLQYISYNFNYTSEPEKVTTPVDIDIPITNKMFDVTTENKWIVEASTVNKENTEMVEMHNNVQIYNETNINMSQVLTHDTTNAFKENSLINLDSLDILNKTITDNYIDDTYDFLHGDNKNDIQEIVTDNFTDYLDIDYTDFYKDTTNEDADYTPAVYIPTTTESVKVILDKKPSDAVDSVYPWITTVFLMNTESKQFQYICDGSLVSERVVLTAARCVIKDNVTVDAANTLIILGKRSLQAMGPNEKVLRVKSIKINDNFVSTEGKVDNDLAIVVLAEPVFFNADIQPASLTVPDKSDPMATATTGWHVSGPLQPLYLEPQSKDSCMKDTNSSNLLCATLGDNETTCPSFGGLLIERRDNYQWHLKGIASGSPTNEGVCFNKHLTFTNVQNYLEWIMKNVQESSK